MIRVKYFLLILFIIFNLYSTLLSIHSFVRWLVLISLVYAVFRSWNGWYTNKAFKKADNFFFRATSTIIQIQFVVGVWLYFKSPVVSYFIHNFKDAISNRNFRFFGMEHPVMMVMSVGFISAGISAAKRKKTDKEKFKIIAVCFFIALISILLSIPWPFFPLTPNRPYFR